MSALHDKLHGVLGPESVPGVPISQYTVDGREPQAVVMPMTDDGVGRLIGWLGVHGHSVIPWGGGTSIGIGNPPAKYDVAIDLCRLNRLVEYTPEDMTVTVEAGMTLGELQQRLRERGQFLPVEAPDKATIGGLIASNRYGPSRLAWGMIRDWLIGIRFVRGDGKLIHGGGKVVKNVAGYDLCKLLVGSYGTLGIITEATFKVAPIPLASYTCVTALAHLPSINASPLRPQFIEVLNTHSCHAIGIEPVAEDTVVIGVSGTPEEVDWQAAQLATKQIEFSTRQLDALGAREEVGLRLVGQFSEFNQLHHHVLENFGRRTLVAAHANLCVFRCAMSMTPTLPESIQRLRQKYTVIVERGPEKLKHSVDAWGDVGSSLGLMKQVKRELDPRGLLSVGRFVGGM